jgi:hypothetical protein
MTEAELAHVPCEPIGFIQSIVAEVAFTYSCVAIAHTHLFVGLAVVASDVVAFSGRVSRHHKWAIEHSTHAVSIVAVSRGTHTCARVSFVGISIKRICDTGAHATSAVYCVSTVHLEVDTVAQQFVTAARDTTKWVHTAAGVKVST